MTAPKPKPDPVQLETVPDEPFVVDWHGFDVTLPSRVEDLPYRAVQAFSREDHPLAIELILGAERLEELLAGFAEKFGHEATVGEINEMFQEAAVRWGFETPGE